MPKGVCARQALQHTPLNPSETFFLEIIVSRRHIESFSKKSVKRFVKTPGIVKFHSYENKEMRMPIN